MKNLKELYALLEKENSFSRMNKYQIEKNFQLLQEKYKQQKYKKICRWEMCIWAFYIEDGYFKPQRSWTTKNGDIYEYPSIEKDFEGDAFKYLNERIETIINPFLLARYNHLLWQSKFKHRKFAVNAIESYLKIIDSKLPDVDDLKSICKSLISIAFQAKYKVDYVLRRVDALIQNNKVENFEANRIAKFILDNYKNKKCNNLLLTVFTFNKEYLNTSAKENFSLPDVCDVNIEIGKRLKLDIKEFYLLKAEHYIYLIDNNKSKHKQHFYFKAIQVYEEIGEKSKLDDLYVLLENTKDEIRMGLVKEEFSGKEIQGIFKAIEYRAEKLTDLESNEIYDFLAANTEILPKSESFYKKREPSFLDSISSTSYDINRNFVSGEEAKDSLNLYGLHLTNFSIRELLMIFKKGVIKGNISYNSLITFLISKSWIGKSYTEKDYDGKEVGFNLINTLAPSIFDFFTLFDATIKSKQFNNTAYVLCSDSLTLKLEGLIRHFAKIIDCPTIIINKRKNGTRQRYIEEIVTNEKFKEFLNDDDITFILYVLTNKGMNIRNNIAHSFYKYENYSESLVILLITVLLRLSKFDFKKEEK